MPVQVKATFKLTGWNTNQLKLRIPFILTKYAPVIDQQLKEEIQRFQFSWPRETKRKNRSVVGSPRDIVDMGTFLRSQRKHLNEDGGYSIRFTWDTPYAGLILTGYTTSKGTLVPGRNWIKLALEAQPLDTFFAAQWRKLASQKL